MLWGSLRGRHILLDDIKSRIRVKHPSLHLQLLPLLSYYILVLPCMLLYVILRHWEMSLLDLPELLDPLTLRLPDLLIRVLPLDLKEQFLLLGYLLGLLYHPLLGDLPVLDPLPYLLLYLLPFPVLLRLLCRLLLFQLPLSLLELLVELLLLSLEVLHLLPLALPLLLIKLLHETLALLGLLLNHRYPWLLHFGRVVIPPRWRLCRVSCHQRGGLCQDFHLNILL